MRREFKDILFEKMIADDKIILLTGDLGFGMFDKIRDMFESQGRYINVGSDEFTMVGVSVGLALSGKIPVCYSISSFLVWRPAELLRLYLNHEEVPVKLLGGGRDNDYASQGFTHDCTDTRELMGILPKIKCYWPKDIEEMKLNTDEWLYNWKPSYLNLKR